MWGKSLPVTVSREFGIFGVVYELDESQILATAILAIQISGP